MGDITVATSTFCTSMIGTSVNNGGHALNSIPGNIIYCSLHGQVTIVKRILYFTEAFIVK